MGNEMGNNNSSGLHEEENTNTRDQKRSLQESGHGDGAEVENHIGPVSEGKDYHEKETGLNYDAPKAEGDSQFVNQIANEKDRGETEVHYPPKSPEVEVKSKDELSDGTGQIQPISLSKDSNDKLQQSSLVKNLSQLNDLKLEKQTSIKKEDEEMNKSIFDTESSSNDSEPTEWVESKPDQPDKLAEIQANLSLQDSNRSPLETEDILESNLTCISEENGHLIGHDISKDKGGSFVSVSGVIEDVEIKRDDLSVKEMASKEEEMSCEEKLEIKGDQIGNDIGQKSMMSSEFSSGVEIKCNGDLPTEINPVTSDSLQAEVEAISMDKLPSSHLEVSEFTDNSVTFTAEMISIDKESEHGDNRPCPCPAQSCEESVKGSEIDNANVSQPELVMMESECENSGKRATDYTCSNAGSNQDCIEEVNVAQPALVMIEPELVNNEKREADYASSGLGINKNRIEEANVSQSELLMIEPEPVNSGKRAADYAPIDPGINKDSMVEANVSQAELVMIEPKPVNNGKRETDYAFSDPGINKDSSEEANVSQPELVVIETEAVNYIKRATDYASSDPGINKDSIEANVSESELVMVESETENSRTRSTFSNSGIEECIEGAKVAENGHLIDVHINDQNEASAEQHNDSTAEALMVPESGVFLVESYLMPCKVEEVLKETKIVEEIEEKNKASCNIEFNTKVTESGNHCMPPTLPVEQEEAFLPESSLSFNQPQDNQENNEWESEKIKSSNESISELNQEDCGEFLVTEVSSFDSTNLMSKTLLSVAELAIEKPGQDISEYTIKPAVTVAESKPPANSFSGQYAKDHETPAFASESYQAQESVERHSTESNPNNSISQAQMQKSPSFGLDLRIEARSEESDRTPLLYQDKTAIEDFSSQAYISLGNSIEHAQNSQDTLQYPAMPVEEKVVRMERSDSEKSKNPFLGFLKEEEEAHILITPQKQDNNTAAKKGNEEVTSASPKSKEKRKARSSLFTNCMCCTTVIN